VPAIDVLTRTSLQAEMLQAGFPTLTVTRSRGIFTRLLQLQAIETAVLFLSIIDLKEQVADYCLCVAQCQSALIASRN